MRTNNAGVTSGGTAYAFLCDHARGEHERNRETEEMSPVHALIDIPEHRDRFMSQDVERTVCRSTFDVVRSKATDALCTTRSARLQEHGWEYSHHFST